MKKTRYILPAILALILCACEREPWSEEPQRAGIAFSADMSPLLTKSSSYFAGELPLVDAAPGDTLGIFGLEEDFPLRDSVKTKANIYTGTSLPTSVSLGVTAYTYDSPGAAESAWTLYTSPSVVRADYDGSRGGDASGKWVPAVRILWPETGCMRFFAYAPHDAATVSASSGSAPQLSFTVESDYQNQVDLLVADEASTAEREGDPPVTAIDVPMRFVHALSGIRFRVHKDLTITSISVNDVYSQGTLSLSDRQWSGQSAKASYTMTNPTHVPDGNDHSRLSDEYTLLLLPQTLPEGARIVVSLTNGIAPINITAVMDGQVWSPGKLITYTIGAGGGNLTYTLEGMSSLESVSYKGATDLLSSAFRSYVTTPGGENFPVPYVLEYSADGSNWSATPPSWIQVGSESSFGGSVEGERLTVAVAPQVNSGSNSHHTALAARPAQTDFDLSTHDVATGATVARSTANCYVVSAPGTYRFPLVYGNALKDGSPNPEAYTSASGSNILTPFKNYLDQNITGPYMVPQLAGKTLTAAVLWTDVPGLVCDAGLAALDSSGGQEAYLSFRVPGEYINQGNALVALLADGDVAWSWHIWVTDRDLTAVQDSPSGYSFSPVNLGWCDGGGESYPYRRIYVRAVQQVTGGKTHGRRTVAQNNYTITTGGNSPYYEWGRKDPIAACSGNDATSQKIYYPSQDAYSFSKVSGAVSLGTAIRTPWKAYYTFGTDAYNYDWCSPPFYLNLWSDDVKTIYDPSPNGFRIPPVRAFSGFTSTNLSWVNSSPRGRRYGSGLFFPANGFRGNGGALSLQDVNSSGVYWAAGRTERLKCWAYTFSSSSASLVSVYAANGNSVRPVVEGVTKQVYRFGALRSVTVEFSGGIEQLSQETLFKSSMLHDGIETPVPFSLEYSETGAEPWTSTPPSWLTASSSSGWMGSVEGEVLTLTCAPQANSGADGHHAILAARTPAVDFDLSTVNVATGASVARTTANCYVVQAPGTYRLPLVYGNGVKNGTFNETAYRSKAGPNASSFRPDDGETYYLGSFKDHLDQNIYNGGDSRSSPYLTTHLGRSASEFKALLTWEDSPGLIEVDADISGTGENAYLTFSVPAEHICQGNARVAVFVDDDNDGEPETIAWSWHIWVTDQDFTATKAGSSPFVFSPVSLGWCDGPKREIFEPRSYYVRAVQQESGRVTYGVAVNQTAYTHNLSSNTLYYLWGNFNPTEAHNHSHAFTNPVKDYSKFYYNTYTLKGERYPYVYYPLTLGEAIQNNVLSYSPKTSVVNINDWCATPYNNLWNSSYCGVDVTSPDEMTKTIYDPSPVGFCVPPRSAWADFDMSNYEYAQVADMKGGRYTPSGLFFPTTGMRHYGGGGTDHYWSYVGYWSSCPTWKSTEYQSPSCAVMFCGDLVPYQPVVERVVFYERYKSYGVPIIPVVDNN